MRVMRSRTRALMSDSRLGVVVAAVVRGGTNVSYSMKHLPPDISMDSFASG